MGYRSQQEARIAELETELDLSEQRVKGMKEKMKKGVSCEEDIIKKLDHRLEWGTFLSWVVMLISFPFIPLLINYKKSCMSRHVPNFLLSLMLLNGLYTATSYFIVGFANFTRAGVAIEWVIYAVLLLVHGASLFDSGLTHKLIQIDAIEEESSSTLGDCDY
jgi:hypothetical protein